MNNNAKNQGIGSYVGEVNQLRTDELLRNLISQDTNLENAMSELQQIRDIVAAPEHIQGSSATKHGKVAEHVEVAFNNADDLIIGEPKRYSTEPKQDSHVDYWKDENPVQSKFVQKGKSFDAITEHLEKYPDFLSGQGGSYSIPRDHYDKIQEWRSLSPDELKNMPASEGGNTARRVIQKINDFEKNNNVVFEDVVHPSQTTYDDVQLGKIEETVSDKESQIAEKDQMERQKYELKARASLREGLKTAGIAAAVDGILSFGSIIISKFSQGKKLGDFTENDWKDIFKETGEGVVRGGVMGGGIYALTNLAGMSAPLAAGIITATIGVAKQAVQLAKGRISTDDFMYNILQLSVDAAVSGVGAFIGQALIPVPVLGAVIGSLVATKIYGLIRSVFFGGGYYELLRRAGHLNELTSVLGY